jgi:lipopolysaccharide/colanic/teichoic acid biosynthesis glycosyltransferase
MDAFEGMSSAKCDAVEFTCDAYRSGSTDSFVSSSNGSIMPFFIKKQQFWKRSTDIIGSLALLLLFWPVLVVIGIIIKLVSPGPVIFKQVRIGYRGTPFKFYKFRTMNVNYNISQHKQYLRQLICESKSAQSPSPPMVKLDEGNPEIFPFGVFLRKTCMDELPQLINVLKGEMSLVGPRPPIPYEVTEYGIWHNGRFDAVPGMTGLWQVSGKNRLSFKEMIRLDIRYSENLSFFNDIKIILMTPYIILSDYIGYSFYNEWIREKRRHASD